MEAEPDDGSIVTPARPGTYQRPPARSKWASAVEAKMVLIASTVQLEDYYWFPFLVHISGGAAFLLPYLMFLVLLGLPMLLLQLSIGQFMDRGTLQVWNMAPLFKGVGIVITVGASQHVWLAASRLNVMGLVAYDLAVLAHPPLTLTSQHSSNFSYDSPDYGDNWYREPTRTHLQKMTSERWRFYSPGGDNTIDGGKVVVTLLGLLFALALSGLGRRVIGKFSMVCLIFSQVSTLMLLPRALIVPGATLGVEYLWIPNFYRLTMPETWLRAGGAALYSLSPFSGSAITIGSYNTFHNNFLLDGLLVLVVKVLMGTVAATMMFATYGFASHVMGTSLGTLPNEFGVQLALAVETLRIMPVGGFWAAIFIISMLLLSINSVFWQFETVVVAIHDCLPPTPRFRLLRNKFVLGAVLLVPLFFWSLGYCFTDASSIAHLSVFTGGFSVISATCFFQCIAVGWLYGPRRILANWSAMLGYHCCPYPLIFFSIICPLLLVVLFVLTCIVLRSYSILGIIEVCGLLMVILIIVITGIVKFARQPGTLRQKWRAVAEPSGLQDHQLTSEDRYRHQDVAMATITA